MYIIRKLSVTHSRKLEIFYHLFEGALIKLHKLWNWIGYDRIETPVRIFEKTVKGLMFDCQMCGMCSLSTSGMSCPMNCPKSIRNGPCGGVRMDGNCEVKPEMRCVWLEAWRGSQQMKSDEIFKIQLPVNHSIQGQSAWLHVVKTHYREKANELGKH